MTGERRGPDAHDRSLAVREAAVREAAVREAAARTWPPRTDAAAGDALEIEALVTDRYLDALLAAGDRHAHDAPADPALDPTVRLAARLLRRDLGRVHPSFRFEERLAARLAEAAARMRLPAAARMRLPAAAGAEGTLIPLGPTAVRDPAAEPLSGEEPPTPAALFGPGLARPLLIGGALTSAALSIAGAAYVAWRRGRPPRNPIARAVRAARAGRAELGGVRLD